LKLWLIADDVPGTGTTDFTVWTDHRGGAFPQISRSGGINVERVANALNGHKIVRSTAALSYPRFDATTFCKGHMRNVASGMIIAVWKPIASAAGTVASLFHFSVNTNVNTDRFNMSARQNTDDRIGVYRRTDGESANITNPAASRRAGSWGIYGTLVNFSAGSGLLIDNGTDITSSYTSTTGNTSDTDSLEVSLFSLLTTQTSSGDMEMAELLTVTPAPSLSDRQKTEGYLAWKYALQGLLPAGHPYKSAAP
jgi:hypothetical protein